MTYPFKIWHYGGRTPTLLLAVLLMVTNAATAQTSAIEKSRELVLTFVEKNNIPGLSISVSRNGEILWSEGFGYADLENQVRVSPSGTKFRIGSVSKTFTATAIGLLLQQDRLDLDKPIQSYVPDFPTKKWNISIRQLAGHTAGIRHYRANEFLNTKRYTVQEGLTIFERDSLLFKPGTQYAYSSYGWNLISVAIANIAKEKFLDVMDKYVFKAIKMVSTVPEYGDSLIDNRTDYYILGKDDVILNAPYVDNSYKWAGGGFLSTTEDLILFGQAFIDASILRKETILTLFKPQSTTNGKSTNYGIGWKKYTGNNGGEWYGHSGGSVGGTTIFVLSPSMQMVVAITANLSGVNYDRLHFKVAEYFKD